MTKTSKTGWRFLTLLLIPAFAGMIVFAPMQATAQAVDGAGLFSGGYLIQVCASDKKGKETVKGGHTACQAYIAGVIDYHKLMRSLNTQPLLDICVPNTVPMKRLQDIVWVYLMKHPQHAEFMAAPSVTMALYEYYPCPPPKKRAKPLPRR